MATVTLSLIDILGRRYPITVNKNIPVSELIERVGELIGHPVAGLNHRGHRLDASRLLSDLLYVDPSHPVFILPYYTRVNTSSIVNMPNNLKNSRRERLETHLANLQSPVPRGAEIRRRSNILRGIQTGPGTANLPNNLQGNIASYLGGKRTRKAKKSRKATRRGGRR